MQQTKNKNSSMPHTEKCADILGIQGLLMASGSIFLRRESWIFNKDVKNRLERKIEEF